MRVEQADLDAEKSLVTVRPGHDCFYCGEPIETVPYVIWQGNDRVCTQIGFHVACAEKLGGHLKGDAQPRH